MDIIHQRPLTIGQKRFTRRSALGAAVMLLARSIADHQEPRNAEQSAQQAFDDLLELEIQIAAASGGFRAMESHQRPHKFTKETAAFPQKGSA